MWLVRSVLPALFVAAAFASTVWADDIQELEPGNRQSDRKPLVTIIPEYPPSARRDRIEGEVQVCFEISRGGKPRRIGVRKSSHRLFEKPAVRAVRASTYVPLPSGADVPRIKHCRTFRFKLEPVVTEAAS